VGISLRRKIDMTMTTTFISVEMRHAVTTPTYLLRRAVDKFLFTISSPRPVTLKAIGPVLARVTFPSLRPSGWLPLYTMVTFRPDISYATVKRKYERQSAQLSNLGYLSTGALSIASLGLAWMMYGRHLIRQP